ncbi:hypothetical protein L3Q82_007777 [Scortum barcoo]|uniref:Uncharacterized protein n=1 Tax=Scortum barcoo TaxID=214431 RepID=A0ACB8WN35_9TELE|nr:hypothetical protein L3Q82_007777 [Scortum barcoo]
MRFSSDWSWNTGPALYPPQGAWRVYGSLPNQSTCALWMWRRHSTVSLDGILWGVCSSEYGVRGPLLRRAVRSLYDPGAGAILGSVRIAGNDVVLMASSGQDLQRVLERFAA